MMNRSVLKNAQLKSPLAQTAALKPSQGKGKKTLALALTLTSLVDAFSILVIYLLVNMGSSQETLNIGQSILPSAAKAASLERGTVLKIEQGRYFINDKQIQLSKLADELARIQEQLPEEKKGERPQLIIQADRKTDFSALNPIIQSSSQAGFYILKFAVLNEEAI